MYSRYILVQLFIGTVICIQSSKNIDDRLSFWDLVGNWNHSAEDRLDANITSGKVQLKVYYETLCPASIRFIVEQLKPAVLRLDSHLDVHLIPYGHATTSLSDGRYYFSCQHGPRECYHNRVHACAIDALRNNTHAILFNSCLMQYTSYNSDYKEFVSIVRECGVTENVHTYDIWKCMNSTHSSDLLKAYGDETNQLDPRYVPYLLLDGSTKDQDRAANNLIEVVCLRLTTMPTACSGYYKHV